MTQNLTFKCKNTLLRKFVSSGKFVSWLISWPISQFQAKLGRISQSKKRQISPRDYDFGNCDFNFNDSNRILVTATSTSTTQTGFWSLLLQLQRLKPDLLKSTSTTQTRFWSLLLQLQRLKPDLLKSQLPTSRFW